jgi:low molecular weight protein-tyrosine phosphatase
VKGLGANLRSSVRRRSEPSSPVVRRVLFVCMGNICRSPTAEGVFRKALGERSPSLAVEVDSAGTHAYHVGHPPDPRAVRAAERRGIDLTAQRARLVAVEDFERFELVLAMDELNRETLLELCPVAHRSRVRLLLEFAPQLGRLNVPDPYYGGSNGFEQVLDLIEEAVEGLLDHLEDTDPVGGSR